MSYSRFFIRAIILVLATKAVSIANAQTAWPTVDQLKGFAFVCGGSVGDQFDATKLNFNFDGQNWTVVGQADDKIKRTQTNEFLKDVIVKDAIPPDFQKNYLDCVTELIFKFVENSNN